MAMLVARVLIDWNVLPQLGMEPLTLRSFHFSRSVFELTNSQDLYHGSLATFRALFCFVVFVYFDGLSFTPLHAFAHFSLHSRARIT